MTPDDYNLQAWVGLIIVNLFLLTWIGLVWSGYLKGRTAERFLAFFVFVALVAVTVHAAVAPVLAH